MPLALVVVGAEASVSLGEGAPDPLPVEMLGPVVGTGGGGLFDGTTISPKVGRAAFGSTAHPSAVDAGHGRGVTTVLV